jgi:methanethiol S-methyltransferase
MLRTAAEQQESDGKGETEQWERTITPARSSMLLARLLTVLAWILGAGSLLAFGAFLWMQQLGAVDLGFASRSALFWDGFLCLLFFAQHSIVIRRPVRNSLRKVVPDHCFYLVYTYTSGIALILLVVFWQHTPADLYAVHGLARWALRIPLLLAFVGVLWGIGSLERFDAFGTDAYLNHLHQRKSPTEHLTVQGPYRIVRHPFYAAGIVALWATPLLSLDRLLLNVLFTGWILLGANLEERDLLARFGEDYALYRQSTPMFVPRLSRQRKRNEGAKAVSGSHAA